MSAAGHWRKAKGQALAAIHELQRKDMDPQRRDDLIAEISTVLLAMQQIEIEPQPDNTKPLTAEAGDGNDNEACDRQFNCRGTDRRD